MRKILTWLCLLIVGNIGAQCSLACFADVDVDMNTACQYTVTEFDLLDMPATSCPGGVYSIDIMDASGTIAGNPTIDVSYVGQTLTFFIIETTTGNSCFGNITANDTSSPSFACNSSVSLDIDNTGSITLLPGDVLVNPLDNCDTNLSSSVSPDIFFCNDVGLPITSILTVTDFSGNSATCFSSITINDVDAPQIVCMASLTLNMNASNSLTLDPQSAVASVTDNCIPTLTASQTIFDCSHLGSNFVTITASDDSGNSNSCFTNVEVLDPSGFCIPPSVVVTGVLNSSQTIQATNFIQFDATVIPGVSIILQAPEVFTVNGCEVQLGGELEINPF